MSRCVRIGNAAGFWGDDLDAPARLLTQDPTLDYLAEVSMSILARQRQRDSDAGYPGDFLHIIQTLAPLWQAGGGFRLVTNAGGLNPPACAAAAARLLAGQGCSHLKLATAIGDDVLPIVKSAAEPFENMETGQPIQTIAASLTTANAYLGAASIAEALRGGADIVITGRVADPSLTVGPCIAHFDWKLDDYRRLAGATVAGHLIECGTQATGGISTDWMNLPDPGHIGFPIAEVFEDGSCLITKPPATGGAVTLRTVKEQLVYEIGDPGRYLSPDATVSLLDLHLEQEAPDRVKISGAVGSPPPDTYKVSATYHAGFRATGMLAVCGRDADAKALRCGQIVLQRLEESAGKPESALVECVGGGSQVMLRVSVADPRRQLVEKFTRLLTPLITAGPQGVTGYADLARPPVHEVFGYWPTLIARDQVCPRVYWLDPSLPAKEGKST